MNLSEEGCLLGDERNGIEFEIALRVYSATALLVLISTVLVSAGWWYWKKKNLVYLKRRSYAAVLVLSLALLTNLYAGAGTRSRATLADVGMPCVPWNINFCSIIPLFVLGSLFNVTKFRYQAIYTAALVKHNGTQEISSYIKVLNSRPFSYFQVLGILGIVFAFILAVSVKSCEGDDCQFFNSLEPFVVLMMIAFFIVACLEVVYIHQQLRTYPDPFDILGSTCRIYFIAFILVLIALPIGILVDLSVKVEDNIVGFSGSVIRDLPIWFFYIYLVPLQIYKAYKFNKNPVTHQDITLEKVLADKTGHDLLKKHLVSEFSVENIIFLDALKALSSVEGKQQKKEMVNKIFADFIQERLMNLPADIYGDLFALKSEGLLSAKCFQAAEQEIMDFVSMDSFLRFKRSKDFEQYTSSI